MKTTHCIGCIDQARLIAVTPGMLLALRGRRTGWLTVVRGEVWATRERCIADLLLGPGGRLRVGGGGTTLVSATPASAPTVITLEPAESRLATCAARLRAACRAAAAAFGAPALPQPRS